jgi:ActR/RegA family two-component response regulator
VARTVADLKFIFPMENTMTEQKQQQSRLLIIEDNSRYKKLLHESLEEDYGYQHFSFAETTAQAHNYLTSEYFDLIIADMRLGEEKDGGFTLLNEIKNHTITSIVIILTANDSIADCRRAFKEGAWDYISKNMRGDVMKILNQSIIDALAYMKKWSNYKDERWIETHQLQLMQQYPEQYIAVLNNRVIDSDEDKTILVQRIQENSRPLLVPIIKQIKVDAIRKLPISQLIEHGESERIEFKETLDSDDKIEKEVVILASLKTIAAFLNTLGGILLIGVTDNGDIAGLERDIKLLRKRQNLDGFEQKLINYIIDRIGTAFSQFITIRFETLDEKNVCVINVEASKQPAFVKRKDKNGGQQKCFYIRASCTTRELDVEEMYSYIQMKNAPISPYTPSK